jgi:hypothetical protein
MGRSIRLSQDRYLNVRDDHDLTEPTLLARLHEVSKTKTLTCFTFIFMVSGVSSTLSLRRADLHFFHAQRHDSLATHNP